MAAFLIGCAFGAACGWLLAGRFPARAQHTVHRIESWWIRRRIRWRIRATGD